VNEWVPVADSWQSRSSVALVERRGLEE